MESTVQKIGAIFHILTFLLLAGGFVFLWFQVKRLAFQDGLKRFYDELNGLSKGYQNIAEPLSKTMEKANDDINKILEEHLKKVNVGIEKTRGAIRYPELKNEDLRFIRTVNVKTHGNRYLEFDLLKDDSTGKEFFVGEDGGLIER